MKNIPATKTNLLKTKKMLTLTEQGYDLLDEKRRMLLLQLNLIIYDAERLHKQVNDKLEKAYKKAEEAIVLNGKEKIERIAISVDVKYKIEIKDTTIMGVHLPLINLQTEENLPYFSPFDNPIHTDEIMKEFIEIIKLISQLAEKKIALLRISRELQKTIKKINALEKIFLPLYKKQLKYISERIEEEERDAFSTLKIIKEQKNKGE